MISLFKWVIVKSTSCGILGECLANDLTDWAVVEVPEGDWVPLQIGLRGKGGVGGVP